MPRPIDDVLRGFDELLFGLEVCRDAVWAKDSDKGFEAITIFLIQFMDLFGHSAPFMAKMFPLLEESKDHIRAKRFEDAEPIVLGLLVTIRMAREQVSRNQS